MRIAIIAFVFSLALPMPILAQDAPPAVQQPPASPPVAEPEARASRTLGLAEAVKTARARQPSLRQAQATTAAARATPSTA